MKISNVPDIDLSIRTLVTLGTCIDKLCTIQVPKITQILISRRNWKKIEIASLNESLHDLVTSSLLPHDDKNRGVRTCWVRSSRECCEARDTGT